jgi:hypothetical protein
MNTLFGHTHLATSLHKGNVGIRTGSTSRPAGKVHLFDVNTQRTACGRSRRAMTVSLVPDGISEQNWHYRIVLCRQCINKNGV